MPPRQRTTFKKGQRKGTTTYKEYNPTQQKAESKMERARRDLDTFIRDNYRPGTGQSTQRPGIESIVQDMPKKFADGFFNKKGEIGNPTPGEKSRYFRKDGSLNEAGKYMLNVYSDDRPEYARQMNRLVTSSPEAARAYAERFPKTAFFENMFPKMIPVVGGLASIDKQRRDKQIAGRTPEEEYKILQQLGLRPDVDVREQQAQEIADDLTSNQATILNTTLEENKPIEDRLQEENIIKTSGAGEEDIIDIFDPEKTAIEAGLTPGTVYDPREDDFKRKVDFLNARLGRNQYSYENQDPVYRSLVEEAFEKEKQRQGLEIRETVDAGNAQQGEEEQKPIAGQFQFENFLSPYQDTINLTGVAEPDPLVDEDYDYTDFDTNQALGERGVDPNLIPAGGVYVPPEKVGDQTLIFTDGAPITNRVDTGVEMIGDRMYPTTGGSQTAIDILNSNADPYFTGYPTMRFDDGGYAGMSTYQKLKMMADSIG